MKHTVGIGIAPMFLTSTKVDNRRGVASDNTLGATLLLNLITTMKPCRLVALLSLVIGAILFSKGYAQTSNKYFGFDPTIVLGMSRIEVIYEVSEEDPYLRKARVEPFILQCGEKASYFTPYRAYQGDSACFSRDYKVTRAEWHELSDSIGILISNPNLIKDRTKRTWVVDNFAFGTYVYEEPMQRISWRLIKGDERVILGQRCRRAECDFRGRHWTAWYAPDLPINDGPYKLDGLPGLILAAESASGQIDIEAVVIRKAGAHPINVRDYFGADETRFITDRKGYYRTISRSKWNFSGSAATLGFGVTNPDGTPVEPMYNRLFYVPYELDWMDKKLRNEWDTQTKKAQSRHE